MSYSMQIFFGISSIIIYLDRGKDYIFWILFLIFGLMFIFNAVKEKKNDVTSKMQ